MQGEGREGACGIVEEERRRKSDFGDCGGIVEAEVGGETGRAVNDEVLIIVGVGGEHLYLELQVLRLVGSRRVVEEMQNFQFSVS